MTSTAMDLIKVLISEKGFNPVSFGLSMLWGILVVGLSSYVASIELNEHTAFQCQIKGDDKDYIQGLCFNNYQTETTKGLSIYGFGFVVLTLNIAVYITYHQCVKSRIKTELDEERQGENHPSDSFGKLFCCYCFQLVIRFIFTTTFVIVQWTALYPVSFPSTYDCVNTSDTIGNATRATYHCTTEQAGNKTLVSIFLFSINVLFAIFILSELIYVFSKVHREINFRRDSKFFIVYLLNDNTNIDDYQNNRKENILIKTKYYEPIFPNLAGEEEKILELNTIFTSLIVYPGRERCDFHGERHEIIEGYIKREARNYSLIEEVRDIFKASEGSEVPSNIMIIGRPGIGKSLLCQKICREMASNGTNQGLSFDFVYLFEFRRLKSDEKLNLRKLFGKCQFSKFFSEAVFRNIRNHPEKVLLIFDGLDEIGTIKENLIKEEQRVENRLSEKMSLSALFGKLIKGTFLKGATIVTTSRPSALSSVANVRFNKTLEILGFTEEEIKQYVNKFTQEDEMKRKMWDHISSNSNLLSLCYIPAICHIVCFSLQQILESEDDGLNYLPLTLTEIHTKAIMYIVKKDNRNFENDAFELEMEPVSSTAIRGFTTMMKAVVKDLGKLAYDGLESGRFIFESSEVTKQKESGLLHQLPGQRLTDEEAQFCFLHLTMQEFVAAAHIVGGDLESLRTWISKHIREGKWQLVIQFIAGLLHEENGGTLRIFTDLMQSNVSHSQESRCWPSQKEMELVLILFRCIFENIVVLKNRNNWNHMITDNFEGVQAVNLSKSRITDADTGAIVYVLQHFHNMHFLDVSCNSIGRLGYLKIFELLRMKNLSTLCITQNQAINEETAKHLSEALSSNECRLTKLVMGANAIGDVGLQHLSVALSKEESKLTTLDISGNEIGDDGVKHLAKALSSNNCKLTTLDISGNQIGVDEVKHLSTALSSNNCKITTLDISGNQIGDDGVKHLSDELSSNNCKLTTLDINGNKLGDDGVKHLAKALSSKKCQITTLDISGNKIGDDGLKHLSKKALTIKECQLTTLDISHNNIGDDGLEHLSDALTKKECQLTTLDISHNNIGDDGVKHLSDALTKKECQLTTLDISHNNIGDDGVRYFSNVLTSSNFKITTLYFLGNAISGSGLEYFHFKNRESKGKISRSKFS